MASDMEEKQTKLKNESNMRPIVIDRVVWSVSLSPNEPCKNG